MLRKARKSDVKTIAQIHFNELRLDFLPSLGMEFLTKLYIDFIINDGVDIAVFRNRDKVCAFIVGANDFGKVFKQIIINNFFGYSYLIAKKIMTKPSIIKYVFDTLIYPVKEGNDVKSELVVIAVSNEYQRKGIGRKLLIELENKFKKRKIMRYKVSVNNKNTRANLFYKSLGFKKTREFYLYNKKLNLLVKNI